MRGKTNKKRINTACSSGINGEDDNKSCGFGLFDEGVVSDILSRLPVKSLLLFKCVSKRWYSLIQEPYFVDLHFLRSKAHLRLFVAEPLYGKNLPERINFCGLPMRFVTTDISFEGKGAVDIISPTTHTNMIPFSYERYIGAVNGLICFTKRTMDGVWLYNISTRELTTWIKSTLPWEVTEKHGRSMYTYGDPSYGFGFDPLTKHYKVVCRWRTWQFGKSEAFHSEYWEVLTLGHNEWRRIDVVPPSTLGVTRFSSVHVNGSIYLCPDKLGGDVAFMLAFDVGCEKFRTIQIPNFILHQPLELNGRRKPCFSVLEVNGRMAFLHKTSGYTVKVWIYEDDDKEMNRATTVDTHARWDENSIDLPVCLENRRFYFHTASGTDQTILEIHRWDNEDSVTESLYSYDWKNNTFKEIVITGIRNSLHKYCPTNLFTAFSENLFSFSPVEKRRYI